MNQHEIVAVERPQTLIESDHFPIDFLSQLAERESWRKEIYRPIYHLHKWWAKRLGSIFRGILLGCLLPADSDFKEEFYRSHNFAGITVFDPFMGSGTTVGEAHKLGATVLGRDINPIACESVRVALGPLDPPAIQRAYEQLAEGVGERISALYRAKDAAGQPCDVLYYFWVKTIPCPTCASTIDLFPTRIFAQNAYPQRKPEVQICCPQCDAIFPAFHTQTRVHCPACQYQFDPRQSTVQGAKATCPTCRQSVSIAQTIQAATTPPAHRLYAKLVLTASGEKQYLPITDEDRAGYAHCQQLLAEEIAAQRVKLPSATLAMGYNTRQALNYNYKEWRDFFNDRQLLALAWLHNGIAELPDPPVRDLFFTLFSSVLEFNNLFATYKGEGTGAVRHMFSHHILKPERLPLEANVWGTAKSSGSFSNLFRIKVQRTVDYRTAPFEVHLNGVGKVFKTSQPFSGKVENRWPMQGNYQTHAIYLSCASSDKTDLPAESIDFVVTDPPFFDNVHYSELADFFLSWQSLKPHGFISASGTTRHPQEVQDVDEEQFTQKLTQVLAECNRILKQNGLLVFTYHHSRNAGWVALGKALVDAGFSVVNVHPIKAEMSVATPKTQAAEPIQLDVIFVCKKRMVDDRPVQAPEVAFPNARFHAQHKLDRLAACGLKLSYNDRKVALLGQLLAQLGPVASAAVMQNGLTAIEACIDQAVTVMTAPEALPMTTTKPDDAHELAQLSFSFAD
ncbi:MAG: DUF1156 domain-containing protein [Caldilinea sp. CFX5]|nr:DUF1156 domain-containing protein [Caldilinea sp. CFX5]